MTRKGKGKKKKMRGEVNIVLCRLVVLYSGTNLSKCVIKCGSSIINEEQGIQAKKIGEFIESSVF